MGFSWSKTTKQSHSIAKNEIAPEMHRGNLFSRSRLRTPVPSEARNSAGVARNDT